jgi:hypothetical protein
MGCRLVRSVAGAVLHCVCMSRRRLIGRAGASGLGRAKKAGGGDKHDNSE